MRTLFLSSLELLAALSVALAPAAFAAKDVAMVTAVQGKVSYSSAAGAEALKSFAKLKAGDSLKLDEGAQVQIIYFENGQQESWGGSGKLQIAATSAQATGLPPPVIKQLPLLIVKQMARTPTLDSQGRAGVVRLRAGTFPDALVKLEENYKKMRAEAASDDINPEVYLLAGLFEGRQLDRVEKMLATLKESYPARAEVIALIALYEQATKEARELASRPAK